MASSLIPMSSGPVNLPATDCEGQGEGGYLSLVHAIPQQRDGASSPSLIPLSPGSPLLRCSDQGVGSAQDSASKDNIDQGHMHGLWWQQGPGTSIQTLVAIGP